MSNIHTRKTFFAKALAGLAGLGLLGGTRAQAKSATSSASSHSAEAAGKAPFTLQVDNRSVARSGDSL